MKKDIPTALEELYDKHTSNASEPSYSELQEAFAAVSGCFKTVFVLVDALDECTAEARGELLRFFRGIIKPTSCSTKLFIASRREDDIVDGFASFPKIEIEAKKVAGDIEAYITAQVNKLISDGKTKESLRQGILDELLDKAGGM